MTIGKRVAVTIGVSAVSVGVISLSFLSMFYLLIHINS